MNFEEMVKKAPMSRGYLGMLVAKNNRQLLIYCQRGYVRVIADWVGAEPHPRLDETAAFIHIRDYEEGITVVIASVLDQRKQYLYEAWKCGDRQIQGYGYFK